ncbi:hypothetical protein C8R43DRAFT_1125782 [Mycena crocata]|nr:hypothetical protein C8R43DRAFT_1125782 [Mycena crocata]
MLPFVQLPVPPPPRPLKPVQLPPVHGFNILSPPKKGRNVVKPMNTKRPPTRPAKRPTLPGKTPIWLPGTPEKSGYSPTDAVRPGSPPPTGSPVEDGGGSSPMQDHADRGPDEEDGANDEACPVGYKEYVQAVVDELVPFLEISTNLYLVQGWDARTQNSKLAPYRMTKHRQGVVLHLHMSGEQGRTDRVRARMGFERIREEFFPLESALPEVNEDVVLYFRQQSHGSKGHLNHFSCPTGNQRGLKGRVEGEDDGQGQWRCVKCGNSPCAYVTACKTQLQQLLQRDPNAIHQPGKEDADAFVPKVREVRGVEDSVSHTTRPPPFWAAICGDPTFDITPLKEAPACLRLDADARPTDRMAIRIADTTVYGLCEAWTTKIELQSCGCRNRSIGPDCRAHGVFNLNNRVLFTHELLDEYTSVFTTSEMPFSSWGTVLSRRYTLRGLAFCNVDLFRAAWFGYAKTLCLEGDMECPLCGTSPIHTIWDGVTLTFNRKHLLASLEPPMVSQPGSLCREKTRGLTCCCGREGLKGARRGRMAPGEDGDSNLQAAATAAAKHVEKLKDKQELVDTIPLVSYMLKQVNTYLALMFEGHFGLESLVGQRRKPLEVYVRLFVQLSAEESVLQMATLKALKKLNVFVQKPTRQSASDLVGIPVLYEILRHEFSKLPTLSTELPQGRAQDVLLKLYNTAVEEVPIIDSEGKPWQETGCCYSMSQIRERPTYPKLRDDTRQDSGGLRGDKCSKFYAQYGEKRLTGGIMVAWCTHSISYGFHCIPQGEGRNDVFAAMVTRWKSPPEMVVYDFACVLGPYCMLREPRFFANTTFVIDDFHAVGHTKCAPAAFLKTYVAVDYRLVALNSSAGESGNSGISRIRKSVSYMSQDRVILYTKIFLSVWNRQRILDINKKMGLGA